VIPGITAWCPNYHKCIMIHFRYHGDTSETTHNFLWLWGQKYLYHDTDFFLIRMALTCIRYLLLKEKESLQCGCSKDNLLFLLWKMTPQLLQTPFDIPLQFPH
jgi:hypothetical protein